MAAVDMARGEDAHRLIADPGDWRRLRWGWLEGVRRDGALSMTARMLAHVLVLDFCNRETLRCDPSYRDLAAVLAVSEDSVRRAVKALVGSGWITTKGGCGRGVSRGYGFLTRAKIVQLKGGKNAPLKGGKSAPFSAPQKVAKMQIKGGKNANAYNNDYNHGKTIARAGAQPRAKLSENPMVDAAARRSVLALRGGQADALDDQPVWVVSHAVAAGLLTESEAKVVGFELAEKGSSDHG